MAETSSSASPQKPLQPPPSGGDPVPTPNSQNPSLTPPQIPPSPTISDLSQISSPQIPQSQPQIDGSGTLDYSMKQQQQQQQQQQQNLMAASSGFQMNQIQQGLQRSGSMPRLTQIQQQYAAAAGAVRQQAGMYGGQMSFGGAQIQQQQQQMAGGMSRAGMIGQVGQLPMLPGQTAAHFGLQSQMIAQQPRQKGLAPGAQFNPANSGQALQGMQTMGVMNTLGLNPQIRASGPLAYGQQQRFNQGQMRPQQIAAALTSPQKLPGQSLPRTPSLAAMNSQLSGLSQNGQSALVQTALTQQQQQQWLKQQMQPSMGGPVSPSYHLQQQQQQQQQQRQQQSFLTQQMSSGQLQRLTQQQISQLIQQQQQQQNMLQQQPQQQQLQQLQQQQQSPRMPSATTPVTATTAVAMTAGSSSQPGEVTSQFLGKRKIQDLVSQVDPLSKLDPVVEDLLLEMADDFIDSVTTFACHLAKHRKSSTLETKDVLLHLEKNWHLTIPGFSRDRKNYQRNSIPADVQKKQMETIRALMESQQLERDPNSIKGVNKQVASDPAGDHPIRASPSSEQLSRPPIGPQMLHKVHQM
ncbi:transcription initiation factor TFIID subunit 12b isoform X2 [Ananas comosus]|uniref:Transcription initiation factor TFIID subunit 12b isoform X2 n=1 Tax=Ananas comosus TaxID=4615 RepID=A0A6P5GYQ2_ANACO|nr:transcription initiation factor TFIID subunit 12b isoform X2 [Ananas comosus]